MALPLHRASAIASISQSAVLAGVYEGEVSRQGPTSFHKGGPVVSRAVASPVDIRRVAGGTRVDPESKGLAPHGSPDEWKIVIPLTDTPNQLWQVAWEETLGSLPNRFANLNDAQLAFLPDAQKIEIWVTEDTAEGLLHELDAALGASNARCAELAEEAERKGAEQSEQRDQVRAEAARLQNRLDRL
jgi:hypothetical protein